MSEATLVNGFCTREDFLGSAKKRFTEVEIQGRKFRLQSLNDREFTRLNAAAVKKDGTLDRIAAQTANARTIVACVVDEEGNRVFSDQDINAIRDLDAGLVQELADACREHIGVGDEDEEGN